MISRLLPAFLLLLALLLTGCSTFNETELGVIRGSGVSPRLYTKMEDGRELRPEDVIELTRRHVPDQYILKQIDDVGVDYALTPEDQKRLKKARVSPPVIDALVTASNQFAERYAAPSYRVYYANPNPYYYDDPYRDGSASFITGDVGVQFSTGRRHWSRR